MGGAISGRSRSARAITTLSKESTVDAVKAPVAEGEVRKVVIMAKSSSFQMSTSKKFMLSSISGSFDKMAATGLYRLAQDGDHTRNEVVREGGVMPLIELFQSKAPEIQEKCLLALSELSKSPECRIRILEEGGCEPMIKGLQSQHFQVREAAASAIHNFSLLDEALFKLVEEGAVLWLLTFLDESTGGSHFMTLQTLSRMLLLCDKHCSQFLEGSVLMRTAFNAVHSSIATSEDRASYLELLSRLCSISRGRGQALKLNGGTGLSRIVALTSSTDDDIASHAATTLENIAKDTNLAYQVVREGALPQLRRMLKSKKGGAAIRSLNALIVIARDPRSRRAICKVDGLVAKVSRLSQAVEVDLQSRATALLAILQGDEGRSGDVERGDGSGDDGGAETLQDAASEQADPERKKDFHISSTSPDVVTSSL